MDFSSLGNLPDEEIDLARTALALSAEYHPGISLSRYDTHFEKLISDTAERYLVLKENGAEGNAGAQLAALKHVLADRNGYGEDDEAPGHPDDAGLIRTIDRRKGPPSALAILYLIAGQGQGWDVRALDFPGHVLCRIEAQGERLIFDPGPCQVLKA